MRGIDEPPVQFFSYVDIEGRVPADHPLRLIRALVDEVLHGLSRVFAKLYARHGRPGVPPEGLLRGSERLLMDQLRTGAPLEPLCPGSRLPSAMIGRSPWREFLPVLWRHPIWRRLWLTSAQQGSSRKPS